MIYEQLSLFAPVTDVFEITQNDIDRALGVGGVFAFGKLRIWEHYQKRLTAEDNIAFLKKEYGISGHSFDVGGYCGFVDYGGKGVTITAFSAPWVKKFITWKAAEKRIGELIYSGKYATQEQIERYRREKEEDNE